MLESSEILTAEVGALRRHTSSWCEALPRCEKRCGAGMSSGAPKRRARGDLTQDRNERSRFAVQTPSSVMASVPPATRP